MAEALLGLGVFPSIFSAALEPATLRRVGEYKGKPGSYCFLEIWDLSASNAPLDDGGSITDHIAQRASARFASQLGRQRSQLPTQRENTIRICVDEFCSEAKVEPDEETVIIIEESSSEKEKEDILSPSQSFFSDTQTGKRRVEPKAGFRALSLVWRSNNPRTWCRADGYELLDSGEDNGGTRQMFLPKILTTLLVQGLWGGIREVMRSPCVQWAKTTKYIRLQHENERLKVMILCRTWAFRQTGHERFKNSDTYPFDATKRFADEFLMLDELYRPFRTPSNLKQIVLLQFYHANLHVFADFLQRIATAYTEDRQRDFDARKANLRQWTFQAIMMDSYLYRQIASAGTELTSMIELLLDVVISLDKSSKSSAHQPDPQPGSSKNYYSDTIPPSSTEGSSLAAELQGCCKDVKLRLSKFSEDLDHDLKFLNLSRDMSQSVNVQRLTLLATVFLPLSLAAGVLSMQTRFKELGSLLYDFFGVVILLGAIVAVMLFLMWLFASVQELESRFVKYSFYRRFGRPILRFVFTLTAMTYSLLVLTSFCVGMFKDVVLGAKILGYGTLVAVFLPAVVGVFVLFLTADIWQLPLLMLGLKHRRVGKSSGATRTEKMKQKDPEKDPGQASEQHTEGTPENDKDKTNDETVSRASDGGDNSNDEVVNVNNQESNDRINTTVDGIADGNKQDSNDGINTMDGKNVDEGKEFRK